MTFIVAAIFFRVIPTYGVLPYAMIYVGNEYYKFKLSACVVSNLTQVLDLLEQGFFQRRGGGIYPPLALACVNQL